MKQLDQNPVACCPGEPWAQDQKAYYEPPPTVHGGSMGIAQPLWQAIHGKLRGGER